MSHGAPIAPIVQPAVMRDRRGMLVILSSPSGAGKTTMARHLMEWDPTLGFSVSATTRPPRPGERDGVHYYFLTEREFGRMADEGALLEHAEVFGHRYGSPRAPVEAALAAGRDVLFDIDWQGTQQIANSGLARDVVSIFLLPPSIAALEARLRGRGQDTEAVIARRMAKSEAEISHWAEYGYVLVNEDAEACQERLRTILMAERLRRERQPWLGGFTRALSEEFRGRQG